MKPSHIDGIREKNYTFSILHVKNPQINCVLGMTLNSSVVVQGMTVKLRPC